MSLNLFLTPGTAPANQKLPGNAQALLNFIAGYVLIAGDDSVGGINFGNATPSPENRAFPWWRTDVDNNPLGMYSWNGSAWVTTPSVVTSGTTAGRPLSAATGTEYFDTTISRLLIWERGQWRTSDGGIGEIREYEGATIDAVLALNPGWVDYSAGAGRVIGGASSDHPYGSSIGEDTHVLTVNELAAHNHTVSAPTCSSADNGDVGAYVVSAATEPNASNLFASPTGNAGADAAHNNIQPTIYLWRIKKT